MGELTGAVAAVQLGKLPRIVRAMRKSKNHIKAMLEGTPGLTFRRLNDEGGDTGAFLIVMLDDAGRAKQAARRMQAAGLGSATRLADYGLHIYSNIPQLVGKVPLSPAGNPWNLTENRNSVYDYRKGSCPASDALFERSVLLPIPSKLTPAQEKVAAGIIRGAVA
jgi:8-amino-3,8-dideoxy-alpha-D-manno-octulosonate transaminase